MFSERKSKKIKVGNTFIGGDSKVTVQSMLNIPAHDIEGNVKQALELQQAGCEIVRVAVPDMEAVRTVAAECGQIFLPLQEMFDDACALAPAEYWIGDGVHPTVAGHKLIADAWMRTFEEKILIK